MIPTINQLLKCYRVIAQSERMKTGRPSEDTVQNCLRGAQSVCAAAGISLDDPITSIGRKSIDAALATFVERGLARISAWSYVCQLRGVFAKWCAPYYLDAGWEVQKLDVPTFRAQAPRYIRPCPETLSRIKSWYKRLQFEHWFAATMMLEFAMRNGDVMRLGKDNFIERDGCRYLSYTPNKTALTSGRRVFWPIHKDIWDKIEECGGLECLDVTDEIFVELNRQLRSIGLRGNKGCYELRKICIDHIYQKFGAEMAVSISGDDIRTITKYYADPSQPNIGSVRVIDLL